MKKNIKEVKANIYKNKVNLERVPFSSQNDKGTISKAQYMDLIEGEVIIEEKVDGATYSLEIPEEPNLNIFAEFLKFKHTVPYNKIPIPSDPRFTWYIIFDIYDKEKKQFYTIEDKNLFSQVCGVCLTKVLFIGKLPAGYAESKKKIEQLARQTSNFGDDLMEGVVIKNYGKNLFGKYINKEFRIEENEHHKFTERNRLAKQTI
jgi:ATP-dependent RNA circularization protein (DNA/RNA ligase family)